MVKTRGQATPSPQRLLRCGVACCCPALQARVLQIALGLQFSIQSPLLKVNLVRTGGPDSLLSCSGKGKLIQLVWDKHAGKLQKSRRWPWPMNP